jgi:hypothetical protein
MAAGQVTVMPWFNPEYYAYFWVGLEQVFGRANLRLDAAPFPPADDSGFHRRRDTFAFVADGRRYFISANDHAEMAAAALEWADVAGSVNLLPGDESAVPLGPAFGVRAWSRLEGVQFASFPRPAAMVWRAMWTTLRQQGRRLSIEEHDALRGPEGYEVWYLGAYWAQHPEMNADRVRFLRAARSVLGHVDGGLKPQGGPLPADLADLAAAGVDHRTFVERTVSSRVVFNHPAVHGCLGWKLGEFLALGKPIITIDPQRRLPAPLEDEEQCLVVEPTEEAIGAAIERLVGDAALRARLGAAARRYYEAYVAPAAMVQRLLTANG